MTPDVPRGLPADDHVHSQWSFDAEHGDMLATCARAVELGLPSIAFTEHVEHTAPVLLGPLGEPHLDALVVDGTFVPPPLDVDGYLASVEACRDRFPSLRIRTGVELGEPHWHPDHVRRVLAGAPFERVLASLHAGTWEGRAADVTQLYAVRPPHQVMADYLVELLALVETYADFQVLAHVDYPVRAWPRGSAYEPRELEEELRAVLRALARADQVLELNTKVPLDPVVLAWWRQEGGGAISFGSDAHAPDRLARGFGDAVRTAEAAGFRPGRDALDFWVTDRIVRFS